MAMELVFSLVGGLGFFFFGMKTMSDGLKNVAGDNLRKILHMATKIPIIGLLIGALVTCLIQSSSATSVMVIGFVNAGLLELRQAICVIMGANIGTTFTAWLVSAMSMLKITEYALPLVGIGFAMNAFGKTKSVRYWGMVMMGFGVLFVGLGFMKDAFGPLKGSSVLKDVFVKFSVNPILGVLVGAVFTMLLQSSSATIAIVQVLAFSGLISFPAAIPLILGDNIGTTITAILASVGGNTNAKRTACSHMMFNVIGVAYMLFFVYSGIYEKVIYAVVPGELTLKNIMLHIAVAHSLFNVANSIIFLPFVGVLEKVCIWLVPKKASAVDLQPQYLERHLLDTPPIAIEQAQMETVRMLGIAEKSISEATKIFFEDDASKIPLVNEYEQAIDNLQSAITQYLIELSQRRLTEEQTQELPVLIHIVNDIERIGDLAQNIVELADRKIEKRLPFTDDALKELSLMWNELHSMAIEAEASLKDGDKNKANSVLERENRVNEFQRKLKKSHVNRLNEGKCNLRSGIVFMDLVDNMEKIGDHLSNIAEGVLGGLRWKLENVISKEREEKDKVKAQVAAADTDD